MRIYLAARFSRYPEMRGVRDVLEALGHEVTSRWIDCVQSSRSFTSIELYDDPNGCSEYAMYDLQDLNAADAIIAFTSHEGGGKGGRHVEFGYAVATGKRLIVCGPRENVFHVLPSVEHHSTWFKLVESLAHERPTAGTVSGG